MLVQGIDSIRSSRVCRRRQDVGVAAGGDDVWRMTSAGTFDMVELNSPAFDGSHCICKVQRSAQHCSIRLAHLPSQKDDSFKVSVWMLTCTSYSSATVKQLSMAAGVVPQSCDSISKRMRTTTKRA